MVFTKLGWLLLPAATMARTHAHASGHANNLKARDTVTETFGGQTYDVLQIPTLRLNISSEQTSSILPAGFQKHNGSRPLPYDIQFDHNVPVAMRDNTTLYVDVFRPVGNESVPAIVIWTPYGKSGSGVLNLASAALRVGVPESRLTGFECFEGPDPADWVSRGYAIVNVDARGSGVSEGDLRWWGSPEAEDGYDMVENIATQPWCTGSVGMMGNSWLAISQWGIASLRPPHLTAIAPLEGASDALREFLMRGGVPNTAFPALIQSTLPGLQTQEDVIGMVEEYPFRDSYWDDKRPDMSKIEVPTYVLGSYSTNLHTLGAFRGFEEITHDKKWLTTHTTQEWYDLYTSERIEDLARFLDFYMKNETSNGWEQTPTIRYGLLGYDVPNQNFSFPALPWTQPNSKKLRLYLNADNTLTPYSTNGNDTATTVSYQADAAPILNTDADPGEIYFNYTFPEKTYVAGSSEVVLHVSAEIQNDMDVYVMLRKADANGNILQSINQPLSALGVNASSVPTVSVLKYPGPEGILRASRRAIAPEYSTPWMPTLSLSANETVPQGNVIPLHISLWPTGMIFNKGDRLLLKVSGHDMRFVDFASLQGSFKVVNEGKHFIHFGVGMENYLDLNLL